MLWGRSVGLKWGRKGDFAPLREDLAMSKDILGFPGGSNGKESACSAVDPGSIPGSGRSPGEGHGYPL